MINPRNVDRRNLNETSRSSAGGVVRNIHPRDVNQRRRTACPSPHPPLPSPLSTLLFPVPPTQLHTLPPELHCEILTCLMHSDLFHDTLDTPAYILANPHAGALLAPIWRRVVREVTRAGRREWARLALQVAARAVREVEMGGLLARREVAERKVWGWRVWERAVGSVLGCGRREEDGGVVHVVERLRKVCERGELGRRVLRGGRVVR